MLSTGPLALLSGSFPCRQIDGDKNFAMWVVLFLQSFSAPAVQLSHLPATGSIGLYCKDFRTVKEENLRRDEPSEQELPMLLRRSSVSSKIFPAVEIPVSTLLGIKEYPLGRFFTFPKKYFPKFLGQE